MSVASDYVKAASIASAPAGHDPSLMAVFLVATIGFARLDARHDRQSAMVRRLSNRASR